MNKIVTHLYKTVVIGGSIEALVYASKLDPKETLLIAPMLKPPGVGEQLNGHSLLLEWTALSLCLSTLGVHPYSGMCKSVDIVRNSSRQFVIQVQSFFGILIEVRAKKLIIFEPDDVKMHIQSEIQAFSGVQSLYVVHDIFQIYKMFSKHSLEVQLVRVVDDFFQGSGAYFFYGGFSSSKQLLLNPYVPHHDTQKYKRRRRMCEIISSPLTGPELLEYDISEVKLALRDRLKQTLFDGRGFEPISRTVYERRIFGESASKALQYAPNVTIDFEYVDSVKRLRKVCLQTKILNSLLV